MRPGLHRGCHLCGSTERAFPYLGEKVSCIVGGADSAIYADFPTEVGKGQKRAFCESFRTRDCIYRLQAGPGAGADSS